VTPTAGADTTGSRRRCVARRRSQPRDRLIRFVIGPGGRLVPDLRGRLPGRGLWLSADREVLLAPRTRKNLARAGAREVDLEALHEELERMLARRCLELVGLARRAGQAVAGFEKVREALARGEVAVLLVARDASANARKRFRQLPPDTLRIEAFDRADLGAALGRPEAVYVALAPGRLAAKLVAEARRLEGLRGGSVSEPDARAAGRGMPAGGEGTHANEDAEDR